VAYTFTVDCTAALAEPSSDERVLQQMRRRRTPSCRAAYSILSNIRHALVPPKPKELDMTRLMSPPS
jgi:hypothetical protein